MAYVLVLLGLLGAFVWASPARSDMHGTIADTSRTLASVARGAAAPLAEHGSRLIQKLRSKALELIRDELHGVVDEKVQ